MDIQIRLATESDLDAIVGLLERDSFNYSPKPRTEWAHAFEEVAAHPDNEIIVATLGDEVVGTLQLTFIPGLNFHWRAQVEAVRVREDLRNLRIGSRLMEWVISRARARQCSLVQLTTNVARKDAQRFYQRLGFKPTHIGMKLNLG
jgi:ribosomal protein S18 acetylase RimI-like enzyme